MGFFLKSKFKRENKVAPSHDRHGFSSKIFSSSKKAVKRERREVAGAKAEHHGHPVLGVFTLWLLFGGVVTYVLFFSPFLSIEDTHIEGGEKISRESVNRIVEGELSGKRFKTWPRNNFFSVRPKEVEELLQKEYPLIRKVVVTRIFPNGVRVDLEERDKIVVWCSGGICNLLSEEGVLVENMNILHEKNAEYIISVSDMSNQPVFPGQRISEDGSLGVFIISIEPALKERVGIEVDLEYTTTSRFADELRIRTKEGWELYLNTTLPIDTSLEDLELLFDKELPVAKRAQLKYIDLRVENRAYYALQDGEEVVAVEDLSHSQEKIDAVKVIEKEKKKKK